MPGELAAKCTAALPLESRLSARLASKWLLAAVRCEAPLVLTPPHWAQSDLPTACLQQLERVCSSFGVRPERCTLRLVAGRYTASELGVHADTELFLAVATALPPGLATTLELASHVSSQSVESVESIQRIVRLASVLPRLTELRLGDLLLCADASELMLRALVPLRTPGPMRHLGPQIVNQAEPTALLVLDVCLTCTALAQLIPTIAALTELRELRLRVACYGACTGYSPAEEDAWSLTHAVLSLPRLCEFEIEILVLVLL
jgi:hypothetical protein